MSDSKFISGNISSSTAYMGSFTASASAGAYQIYGGVDASSSYSSVSTFNYAWNQQEKNLVEHSDVRVFTEAPRKKTNNYSLYIIDCIDKHLEPLEDRTKDITFGIGMMDGQDVILEIINSLASRNGGMFHIDTFMVEVLKDLDLKMNEYHSLYLQNHGVKSIRRYFFGVYFAIKQSIDIILSERIENYTELPEEVQEWAMTFLRQGYSPYQSLISQLNNNYAAYLSEKAKFFLPTETAA